ncbi:MAG: VacJ family lipoprotein [Syntrophales bacterium]|nr:VacJ family lipoprotein [Syntrophales bacterium]MDD5232154.1 VacJ family lipoprotein [Syntrophales bacterium]MDD5533348.1 VacJ family lipoprotein [Syntrophales bacterium]HPL62940.1 VacJ family lipoprotein [Syntrophales bacterium]
MKASVYIIFALLFLGCAHGNQAVVADGPGAEWNPPVFLTAAGVAPSAFESLLRPGVLHSEKDSGKEQAETGDEYLEDVPAGDDEYAEEFKGEEEEEITIADPLEPLNRAMFHFNDRLYFWVLKPVAEGYNKVVPEDARISVRNFFSNLAYPIRLASCLLQADFRGAATETGRFVVNTVWGIGGLLDPASGKDLDLKMQNVDLGQTLGTYGVGHGVYIVWPFIGPSSPRDSVDIVGGYFLYPVYYLEPWYAAWGARAYESVNDTSLRIGDYESLKEAAIDPYIALRNAYAQYRRKLVESRGKTDEPPPGGVRAGAEGIINPGMPAPRRMQISWELAPEAEVNRVARMPASDTASGKEKRP